MNYRDRDLLESFAFQTKTYDDICPRPAYRFDKNSFSTKENQDAFIFEVNNYAKENIALGTIHILRKHY